MTKRKQKTEEPVLENKEPDIKQLSQIECEKWGRLDAEIRNLLLSRKLEQAEKRLAEFEEEKRRQVFSQQQAAKDNKIRQIDIGIIESKSKYDKLINDLAEKYQINKTKMLIDPETGIINEAH